MKLMIEIPEEDYIRLRDEGMFWSVTTLKRAVREGIPLAEQEPCVNAISMDKTIVQLSHLLSDWDDDWNVAIRKCIETVKNVPPVTPQQKMGRWIDIMVGDMPAQVCDQCKTFYPLSYTGGGHNYCPSCGSRMVEPQESEDTE